MNIKIKLLYILLFFILITSCIISIKFSLDNINEYYLVYEIQKLKEIYKNNIKEEELSFTKRFSNSYHYNLSFITPIKTCNETIYSISMIYKNFLVNTMVYYTNKHEFGITKTEFKKICKEYIEYEKNTAIEKEKVQKILDKLKEVNKDNKSLESEKYIIF